MQLLESRDNGEIKLLIDITELATIYDHLDHMDLKHQIYCILEEYNTT
jgi:hypothetical protein